MRLSDGLLQPITTTIGLKQGCCLSGLLFNLFVNKLPSIFDLSCDPVSILDENMSCLLWADDLLIMSRSAKGLQNAIDKTKSFYDSLGLEVPEHLKALVTADGDNSQIATMIANINRYIVNGVIAAKHSASDTACQQAADKAKNFKIAKQLNKTVSTENVPEALHLLKKCSVRST